MEAQLRELLDAVASPSLQVRLEATKILGSVTESLTVELFRSLNIVHALKTRFLDHTAVAHAAVVVLINAHSQHPALIVDIIKQNILSNVMEALQDSKCEIKEVLLMLLNNLSTDSHFALQMLQEHTELEGLFVMKLINWFIKFPGDKRSDPFQFVANILVNLTQHRAGRNLLMHEKRNVLKLLLPFISSDNIIRKLGIIKTARNCCYDRHRHDFLVSEDLGLIEALLDRIIGPEPIHEEDMAKMLPSVRVKITPDAVRDPSMEVRQLCVEIIHLLVVNRPERTYLRSIQVYAVLRELHRVETDEAFLAAIEEAVQWFIMDEADEVDGPNARAFAQGAAAMAGGQLPSIPEMSSQSPAVAPTLMKPIAEEDDEIPSLVPDASIDESVIQQVKVQQKAEDDNAVDAGDGAAKIAQLLDDF